MGTKKVARILIVFALVIILNEQWGMKASAEEERRVLIGFKNTIDYQVIRDMGGEILHTYDSLQAVSLKVKEENVRTARDHKKVEWIEYDQKVTSTQEEKTWGYQTTSPQISRSWGIRGEGVRIAIIDSGISKNHPDLNVQGGVNVKEGETGWQDDNGHGTHVAGVINAQDNNIGVVGIAPEADIFAVKALDSEGTGWESEIIKGIEWAISKEIDVINLSLTSCNSSIMMKEALKEAEAQGIIVVAASGNRKKCNGEYLNDIMYPGRYASVIGVGAITPDNTKASFSYGGRSLDIAGPGASVKSTYYNAETGTNGYTLLSGTSMAAPYVSGIVALNKQAFPNFNTDQIIDTLHSNAIDLGVTGRDDDFGSGLVQSPSEPFLDIDNPGRWSYKYIKDLFEKDLVTGFNDATFRPRIKITRGETVTFFSRALSLNATNRETKFPDVSKGFYASGHIASAVEAGIVVGLPDGRFGPREKVKRGDVALMIQRTFNIPETDNTYFSDVDDDRYYGDAVNAIAEEGIVAGYVDGTFRPENHITRAELVKMLSISLKKIK